jgi:hypothetical protein
VSAPSRPTCPERPTIAPEKRLGGRGAVAGGKKAAWPIRSARTSLNSPRRAFIDVGGNPVDCWKPTRGKAGQKLLVRANFTSPAIQPVLVGGVALKYGGQIADYIQVVLYGSVADRAGAASAPQACEAKLRAAVPSDQLTTRGSCVNPASNRTRTIQLTVILDC